jgi:hypothetical protein
MQRELPEAKQAILQITPNVRNYSTTDSISEGKNLNLTNITM